MLLLIISSSKHMSFLLYMIFKMLIYENACANV